MKSVQLGILVLLSMILATPAFAQNATVWEADSYQKKMNAKQDKQQAKALDQAEQEAIQKDEALRQSTSSSTSEEKTTKKNGIFDILGRVSGMAVAPGAVPIFYVWNDDSNPFETWEDYFADVNDEPREKTDRFYKTIHDEGWKERLKEELEAKEQKPN